jgi:hypothetical protein
MHSFINKWDRKIIKIKFRKPLFSCLSLTTRNFKCPDKKQVCNLRKCFFKIGNLKEEIGKRRIIPNFTFLISDFIFHFSCLSLAKRN